MNINTSTLDFFLSFGSICFLIGIISLVIQWYFWGLVFGSLIKYSLKEANVTKQSLSCLICSKNGSGHLKSLIPEISDQSLNHKLLVIDDFSNDDSLETLSMLSKDYPNLKFGSAPEDIPGKKMALRTGMSMIDTDWLILTDVDCRPNSKEWMKTMRAAADHHKIVLGYSPYRKESGFLNKWIRYEAALTGIQYLSFALNGKPYMGVGRNLLYHKDIFSEYDQLRSHADFASGDDDLFVNAFATKENTTICMDPKSWTISEPEKTWTAYKAQKARHYSVGHKYKSSDVLMLSLFSITWISSYLAIFLLIILGCFWVGIGLWLTRMLISYLTVYKVFPKLGIEDCIPSWWYLDILTVIYYLYFSIFTIRRKNQRF